MLKITINLSLSTAELCTVLYYGTVACLIAAALDMVLYYGTITTVRTASFYGAVLWYKQ
jgi:hypothetical protein